MTATFRTSQSVSDTDVGKPHLILVGLPGAGKSVVGEALAERLNRSFLDFDREIERREGSSISEIFAVSGEPHFRQMEVALTLELRQYGNMVVAPGGGWVTNKGVVEIIRPPDPTTPSGAGVPIITGETSVEWLAPDVRLSHTGPAAAALGQDIVYTTTAKNDGRNCVRMASESAQGTWLRDQAG